MIDERARSDSDGAAMAINVYLVKILAIPTSGALTSPVAVVGVAESAKDPFKGLGADADRVYT
jgi:hypothetical protein